MFDTIKEALATSIQLLPEDKPKFYFGAAPPHLVFDLVASGIDVFDMTWPNLVTERDAMLVFPTSLASPEGHEADRGRTVYELGLSEEAFRLDLGPLVPGCLCHTCTNFSRAYLHHLVTTREMLARVLLSLHNLHHYHTFFESLQAAVREDTVEQLKVAVLGRRHNPAG